MSTRPRAGDSADGTERIPGHGGTEPGGGSVPPVMLLTPPETRGRTRIADRVLERITARAVAETAQAGGTGRRLLGVPLERDTAHTTAQVTAHVDGHLATVKVALSVRYPAPIRQVTRRVREHVNTRVRELTGLEVRQVDIAVVSLTGREQKTAPSAMTGAPATITAPDAQAESQPTQAADRAEQRRQLRAVRRAFRPRRVLPAVVTAATLAAVALFTLVEILATSLDPSANVPPVEWLTSLGRTTRFDDPLAIITATALCVLGIVSIILALKPGSSRLIALVSLDQQTVIGITRTALRQQLTDAATRVDGIIHARVQVNRRRIRVRATSPLRDTRGLAPQIDEAVSDRLQELALLRHLRVCSTVRSQDRRL